MGVYPDERSDFGNPMLSRFLSPDPGTCPVERSDNGIQAPGLPQNYNRYTYALNNPLLYTDPSGYTWKIFKPFVKAWNWFWDTGEKFAEWADENGIPSGGFGINSAGQTSHYVGDYYVDHNQMRVGSNEAIWGKTTVTFNNGINQDGVNFANNLGVASDNVRVNYVAPMDNTRIDPSYLARGGSSGVARIPQGYRLVQFGIAPLGNFSPFAIDGHAKENLDIGNGSPLGIVDIIAGWTSRNIFKPYSNPQNWSGGDTIIMNWNYRVVPALTIMNIKNTDTTFTPIYDGVTPPYWYMPPSNSDYKKRIK